MKMITMLAVLLLAAVPAKAQSRRAVMENLSTTNNVLFVSSDSASVYAFIKRLSIGGMTLPTTTFLDVYGITRVSSSIVTMGGNLRGTNAMDLQLTRNNTWEVPSGESSAILSGGNNAVFADRAIIAGGTGNRIWSTATNASIGGGSGNISSGTMQHIGGGSGNIIQVNSTGGTIAGGTSNSMNDNSDPSEPSFIGGGTLNSADNACVVGGGKNNSCANFGFIGGGRLNSCSNNKCVIAGGESNTASGSQSSVGGGGSNDASGQYSTIPGGLLNTASGNYAFAAGRRCKATAAGSFCMADSSDVDKTNAIADSFKLSFSGGSFLDGGSSTFTAVVIQNSSSPASGVACVRGQFTWDADYLYLCTATGVMKRSALTGGY